MHKLSKKVVALIITALFLLLTACDDVVVDSGGVSTERDTMIYEASKNTTPMP